MYILELLLIGLVTYRSMGVLSNVTGGWNKIDLFYGLSDHLIICSHSCQMLLVEPFEGHSLFRKSHKRIEAPAVTVLTAL